MPKTVTKHCRRLRSHSRSRLRCCRSRILQQKEQTSPHPPSTAPVALTASAVKL